MDNKHLIQIRDLTYYYGSDEREKPALDKVNLTVEAGSFLAVIGRNGSGKSTLAKAINGTILPTAGVITVGNYTTTDEDHLWDVRQKVAMVFQNPDNQIVSAIVEDDVAFGPENLGVPSEEIRQRVNDALKAVGMESCMEKAPHMLSGGQKQRIAIAGAIAMRPECIVFDEPTAMLDPGGRKEVLTIIRKLNSEGITCILITHYMEEAAQADRIAIMDQGKVAVEGTPAEVFGRRAELRKLGLAMPLPVELADRLREKGYALREDIVTEENLIEELCPSS